MACTTSQAVAELRLEWGLLEANLRLAQYTAIKISFISIKFCSLITMSNYIRRVPYFKVIVLIFLTNRLHSFHWNASTCLPSAPPPTFNDSRSSSPKINGKRKQDGSLQKPELTLHLADGHRQYKSPYPFSLETGVSHSHACLCLIPRWHMASLHVLKL